jgi:hypothetical protein
VTHLTVEYLLEVAGRALVNGHLDDFLLFDGSLPLAGLAAARGRDRLTPPLTVTAHALHTSPLSQPYNQLSFDTSPLFSQRTRNYGFVMKHVRILFLIITKLLFKWLYINYFFTCDWETMPGPICTVCIFIPLPRHSYNCQKIKISPYYLSFAVLPAKKIRKFAKSSRNPSDFYENEKKPFL